MVHRIYHTELQLNKANASDTDEAFLDLNLFIHDDTEFEGGTLVLFASVPGHCLSFT